MRRHPKRHDGKSSGEIIPWHWERTLSHEGWPGELILFSLNLSIKLTNRNVKDCSTM